MDREIKDERAVNSQNIENRSRLYKASALRKLPTLSQGHFDNLKIETPTTRVWLSRCGIADGLPYENMIIEERLVDGRWIQAHQYKG